MESSSALSIGVLALQGAFEEHCDALRAVGVGNVTEVRLPEHLDGLDGLVIPGGESTAIIRIAKRWSLVSRGLVLAFLLALHVVE
jgi:5'-phosphate synthase pdxT subunit